MGSQSVMALETRRPTAISISRVPRIVTRPTAGWPKGDHSLRELRNMLKRELENVGDWDGMKK